MSVLYNMQSNCGTQMGQHIQGEPNRLSADQLRYIHLIYNYTQVIDSSIIGKMLF